jgi:integrase
VSAELPPPPAGALAALGRFHRRTSPEGPARTLIDLAGEFVRLKQILGHRYRREAQILADATAFLADRGVDRPADLTASALAAALSAHATLAPRSRERMRATLSTFADHLCASGRLAANPCARLRRSERRAFRPYLFDRQELARLFAIARRTPKTAPRGLVYLTIYACALRRSEALALCLRHFDRVAGTLTIERTKFDKSRLVPLHPSAAERLSAWVDERRRAAGPDMPLFVTARDRRVRPKKLEEAFARDLARIGVARRSRVVDGVRHGAPCLHSLRHSFAVHRLLPWYREGADVQAKLPLLSTFLGHAHIRHTQVYLTVTRALLEEGRRRFAARWEREFPLSP